MSMLALRRVSSIYRYVHPLSAYQYRYLSKKSTDDDDHSKQKPATQQLFSEELLNFERKDFNTSRNVFKNKKRLLNEDKEQSMNREKAGLSNKDGKQTEDLLRSLNVKNLAPRKKSTEERDRAASNDRVQLPKPMNASEKKQKRDAEQTGQKQTKSRPHIILDTDSNDVKILTRQVADSLTPPNSPNESINIEKELLDVLRGHRVVSKTVRQKEKRSEQATPPPPPTQDKSDQKQYDRSSTKRRTPVTPSADVERTTEAFSSLLRDIKLQPTRGTSKSKLDEDFIRDAVDGSMVRPRFSDNREQKRDSSNDSRKSSMRDTTRRRQEFMRPYQLWSGEPLGIFTSKNVNDISSNISPIWDKYDQDELTRISAIPPRNAFEEMIQWTKDGVLWKFPIDNEQDIGAEADIPFHEHVLLERHIQDFPSSPLVRQFMELVCIGLGRNPYWTVEQKLEHINWFRAFFNEKMQVFNETVHTGAIKTAATPAAAKPASTYKAKPTPPPPAPKIAPVVPPVAVKTPTASKK